jgi:CheY-like chemotaxis protein
MKRILIVDDALELGRLLQTVFLTLDPGLSIQVVPSAEEALLESTRKPLDLLVSDIRLPGMTGFDLVKKIRARHPTIKVLFISGLADTNLAERAREMKAEGFFRKPLDMTSFLNAARQCLDMPSETPLTPMRVEAAPARAVITPPSGLSGAPAAPAAAPELLPDLVTGLRQRLGAQAVFVLDERGRIVAQAGDVPALPLEEKWVGPVMAALNSGAKVARLVGESPVHHVMAFPGKDFNLVLAPAGDYALLVLLQPGRSMLRMALAVEEALDAQQALGDTLAAIRRQAAAPVETFPQPEVVLPPTSPLAPTERPALAVLPDPVLQDQSLMDFEVLLNQSADQLKDKDIDEFWDRLSAKGLPGTAVNPDVLSYDQARKLGLTPKEDK